jgi:hypothetical protein
MKTLYFGGLPLSIAYGKYQDPRTRMEKHLLMSHCLFNETMLFFHILVSLLSFFHTMNSYSIGCYTKPPFLMMGWFWLTGNEAGMQAMYGPMPGAPMGGPPSMQM